MPDSNQGQPKQLLLITLVLLFFVIACVQAWHMVRMENQLEVIIQSSSTQLPIEDSTATAEAAETTTTEVITNNQSSSPPDDQTTEQPPLNDDFLNSPYYAQSRDPYEDIRRMQQHMDRAFNDRYNRVNKNPDYQYHYRRHISTPKINVRETNNQYTVFVNIPGTDADNISVNLEGQRLTVKARQGYQKENRDETGRFVFRERQSGSFQRSIMLPEPVDPTGMRSRVDNGVLTIIIPKERY